MKQPNGAFPDAERTTLPLVNLLLTPYDDLVEVDTIHGQMRALRHAEGKYFVPVPDATVTDMLCYSAEYMIHPEDREAYLAFNDPATLARRLKESETPGLIRARFRYKLLKGGWRRVEQVNVGGREQGLPEGVYYAILYDLEERENAPKARKEEHKGGQADRNLLTGLLWKEKFFKRGKPLVEQHADDWCMIAFDLEHFKLFNEWYGRKQGDLLLAKVGARLSRVEEETGGLAGYVGQDDFCLLVPYEMDRIEQLFGEVHALIQEHGTSVGFMPAFGVVPLAANRACGIEDLFDRAALAARRAKENYHTRIRVFDPAMYEQTEKDYQILSDFQEALENRELFFVLQPQCRINTGKVVGAESLVRWKRADGQMVPPGTFVPVLEEYGFVTDMDKYVWEEVCRWQKQWIDAGHTPLPVSVNVSQTDIMTIDVPEHFAGLLKEYALPVDVIKIEITESAYADNDRVIDAVQRLREMGFLVLMDDFGSGYSSLNMLRNLNVDVIKLDAQFLRMGGEDRRKGLQIMETIVNMAKTMSVPIIVEGVETKEESDFLSGLGCRYVQGYFFYRPMQVPDFERLITDPQQIDTRGFRFKAREQFHIREFLDRELFSDTVLNNILGPVAFYSRHGEDVDIIRFNRQFHMETRQLGFSRQQSAIQKRVAEEDRPLLYELLERAAADPLNGAEGVLRFKQPDGQFSQFRMHFFFLEKDESGQRFYGSARDLTEFVTLNDHMRLLSRVSSDTVLFVCRQNGKWSFRAVIHGLADAMGLSAEALEESLSDGTFYSRVPDGDRERLIRLGMHPEEAPEGFSLRLRGADGQLLDLRAKCDAVHDEASGVEYIFSFWKPEN